MTLITCLILCMHAHVVPSANVPSQTPITIAKRILCIVYCRPEVG